MRYKPSVAADEQWLRDRIVELAQQRRRFGYRRIHALLRREGVQVSPKKVYRLYRAQGLTLSKRKRRKGVTVKRALPGSSGRCE